MTSKPIARWVPLVALAIALFAAPSFLDEFRLNLLAKFLTFAIVALGLDLVWGYTGMLSLGHGVFFGLGGYAAAMYLKLESTGGGLADFMGWSGLKELPAFWQPFQNPVFAFSMAIIVPMLFAALVAYLVGSSRITGVYFSLLTQALALIVTTLMIGQQPFTGGTNGITNFSTVFGYPLAAPETKTALYLITVVALIASYVICRGLVGSRFGSLLVAIRDDEQRVRFCGYDPRAAKVLVMALSGALAGAAGALFVMQVGIISPSSMGIVPSVEMVIWVALGGRGTLIGAVLGAILVNSAKSGLSESFPDIWQLTFGVMLVAVVLLFPDGLVGFVRRMLTQLRGRFSLPGVPSMAPSQVETAHD